MKTSNIAVAWLAISMFASPLEALGNAERLYEAARSLVEVAGAADHPALRYPILDRARGKLEAIMLRYPSTDLAARLVEGDELALRIDRWRLIDRELMRRARANIRARADPCYAVPDVDCLAELSLDLMDHLAGLSFDKYSHGAHYSTLIRIAEAKARTDRADQAAHAFEAAIGLAYRSADARSFEFKNPVVQALIEIGEAQAVAGQTEASARTFRRAIAATETTADHGLRIRDLVEIANTQAESGLIEEMLMSHNAAIFLTSGLDAPKRKVELFVIAKMQLIKGLKSEAERTLGSISIVNFFDNIDLHDLNIERAYDLLAVAELLIAAGRPGEVDNIIHHIMNIKWEDDEYFWTSENLTRVAKLQVDAGSLDDALATARAITEARLRAEALLEIGRAQAAAGSTGVANWIFAAALSAAVEPTYGFRSYGLVGDIGKAQAVAGFRDEALATFRQALSLVQDGDEHDDRMVVEEILQAMVDAGFLDEVLALLPTHSPRWEERRWFDAVRDKLVVALAATGRLSEALDATGGKEALLFIPNYPRLAELYAGIAAALAQSPQ